ncbi:DNA-binding response regulator [Adhaeribacter arboris]|uniref:DNA-binding response regulator n=1 Tax=Adhaeribacter arboris TaxID=2072846 RepID=A0A2T2YNB2_9BACT|nr:response regulator transcription factor [Adhaeribacter arboris]PSR56997.1 DNA-binding response regulator [Adhaeribacter arboris]
MKILVIEDDPDMLDTITQSLQKEKYVVEVATTYDGALEKIGVYAYDCILLDITLPGGSGLDLLQELKKQQKAEGVIIISAKNSLDDKVTGLELGADDYLAKPFHLAELHARVKSVLRRRKFEGNANLTLENVVIDPDKHLVWVAVEELILNRKQFDVLLYFCNRSESLNVTF